jgi:hypothetical protein
MGTYPSSLLHTPDDVIATEGLVDSTAHDHLSGFHPLHKEQAIFTNGATSPHIHLHQVCEQGRACVETVCSPSPAFEKPITP